MIDLLAKRDIIEQIIPHNASPAARNAGVAGAWSAYVQIIAAASLTYPFILCGAYVFEAFSLAPGDGTQVGLVNIQVATGALGSEVLIAEGHGGLTQTAPTLDASTSGWTGRTCFFEPILIPASTRLSYRTSVTSAKTLVTALYLVGYDARYFAQPLKEVDELRYIRGLCSPIQGATVWPSPGTTNVTTGAVAWTYGAAVQFIASAATPLLITGLHGSAALISGIFMQAHIGIGAAGSEQWMSKVGLPVPTGYPGPFCDCYLPRPLYVKQGEAVSVQVGGAGLNKAVGIALKGFALK